VFGETPNPKEFGRYVALGQVGLEMVAPVALGLVLDRYLGWAPWGLIGGAAFGLFGGLAHLVHMLGKEDDRPGPGEPNPPDNRGTKQT
jgi:F0F1-type ATP synthase assembly protein I